MARLGDVFNLQMGKTPARANATYWTNGTNAWVSIADLSGYEKYVGDTKEQITDLAVQESGIKAVPADTIIMSFKLSLGKTAITKVPIYTNEAIMAFLPTGKYDVCPDYFFHLFSGRDWSEGTNRAVMGATLNKATLSNMEVVIPPLEEQRRIAAVLDKVSDLIAKRREQLDKLDELVKARFVEMFGDPETNPKGYEIRKLGTLARKISDGVHAKPDYTEIGRPFLSVVNINKGVINFNDCKFVSEEAYQKMIKSTHPERGDILYTKVGATYGIPAYVDTDTEFCLYVSVCLIKPKHDEINSKFLALSMGMSYVKRQADRRIKGIGVPDLHLNQICEFDIVCPPRAEQETFVSFSEQIDESKLTIQQSLDKLEVLKKALMQKYFNQSGCV